MSELVNATLFLNLAIYILVSSKSQLRQNAFSIYSCLQVDFGQHCITFNWLRPNKTYTSSGSNSDNPSSLQASVHL